MLQCSDRAFWRPRFLAHCLFSFSYFIMEQKKIKTMISHLFSEIWGGVLLSMKTVHNSGLRLCIEHQQYLETVQ